MTGQDRDGSPVKWGHYAHLTPEQLQALDDDNARRERIVQVDAAVAAVDRLLALPRPPREGDADTPLIVARQEGKRAHLHGLTDAAVTAWPAALPPPTREEFAEQVRAAVAKVAADPLADLRDAVQRIATLPRPPRCVVMNPADLDTLLPRTATGGAALPALPALGVPVFVDPDVPAGRPEFRDECPAPKAQP